MYLVDYDFTDPLKFRQVFRGLSDVETLTSFNDFTINVVATLMRAERRTIMPNDLRFRQRLTRKLAWFDTADHRPETLRAAYHYQLDIWVHGGTHYDAHCLFRLNPEGRMDKRYMENEFALPTPVLHDAHVRPYIRGQIHQKIFQNWPEYMEGKIQLDWTDPQ